MFATDHDGGRIGSRPFGEQSEPKRTQCLLPHIDCTRSGTSLTERAWTNQRIGGKLKGSSDFPEADSVDVLADVLEELDKSRLLLHQSDCDYADAV